MRARDGEVSTLAAPESRSLASGSLVWSRFNVAASKLQLRLGFVRILRSGEAKLERSILTPDFFSRFLSNASLALCSKLRKVQRRQHQQSDKPVKPKLRGGVTKASKSDLKPRATTSQQTQKKMSNTCIHTDTQQTRPNASIPTCLIGDGGGCSLETKEALLRNPSFTATRMSMVQNKKMPLRGAEKASASPAKFSPQKLSVDKQKKNRDKKATSLRLHSKRRAHVALLFLPLRPQPNYLEVVWLRPHGSWAVNPSQPSHASSVAGSSAASGQQLFDFTSKSSLTW